MGIIRKALTSRPVASLTSPFTVDHYLEQIHPMLAAGNVRARVVEVRRETGVASTVVMRPNGAWEGFRPGQHVQFGVEVDGKRRVRVFSVSSSQTAGKGTFSVSVKAHPDGYVSQFLHHELQPGTIVFLSQAEGEFVLPREVSSPLLLVSGGSGATPVMSMLRTLRDTHHTGDVTFLHYARSRDDEMFTDELDEIAATSDFRVVRVYTREPEPGAELAGRFHVDHLKHLGIDPSTTLTYACGPAGLIASVRDTYDELGAAEQLHVEYFKVPSVDLGAADATGALTFDDAGIEAPNSGATILVQAEEAGLKPEFGCRMGVCNTCAVKKNSGAVRHVVSGEINASTDETIKICVQVPIGDVNVAL
ncbi:MULTISPECIES: ferredoxin reductase [Aeromicrobium]|uniref:2Fe-2S iron-sulfur cluster binding domain-containing protein n=1 Tax=Aeromicrobium yanjiei TaxID=2662028 RepID=A0A5Q2MM51_9ACTN|nr:MULTISPECIES: ferredoxin reductase [Aeromicrobium]MRK02268.1 2Fe-2S iron-sulfur cluster binding domain-containing protein [Aeromicrobium sp. S22]QGG41010.1 2Fe-2S iron-sulfur cluster binding domain-containing protein [Aeromicrobium yanjiei]